MEDRIKQKKGSATSKKGHWKSFNHKTNKKNMKKKKPQKA